MMSCLSETVLSCLVLSNAGSYRVSTPSLAMSIKYKNGMCMGGPGQPAPDPGQGTHPKGVPAPHAGAQAGRNHR